MRKTLRKLCFIPVLLLVFAAVTGVPGTAAANQQACYVFYIACPEPYYDCCCGFYQACLSSSWECERACNRWG